MVLKGKAPVSEEVLKVKLPVAKETTLPNGLRLMVLEDHRVPQVSFQLMIPGAGGYFDPADRAGLATWTAAMIREGTSSRTSAQISEALETMGASLFTSGGASSANAEIDAASAAAEQSIMARTCGLSICRTMSAASCAVLMKAVWLRDSASTQ